MLNTLQIQGHCMYTQGTPSYLLHLILSKYISPLLIGNTKRSQIKRVFPWESFLIIFLENCSVPEIIDTTFYLLSEHNLSQGSEGVRHFLDGKCRTMHPMPTYLCFFKLLYSWLVSYDRYEAMHD